VGALPLLGLWPVWQVLLLPAWDGFPLILKGVLLGGVGVEVRRRRMWNAPARDLTPSVRSRALGTVAAAI
jgi:hypothetical protein